MILKSLFSSQTRIKLLKLFLSEQKEEFYIRQLTRLLDEQLNSIRRELDNLKKIGFLSYRIRNRKKYFYVNPKFLILDELSAIFNKTSARDFNLKKDIQEMGQVELIVLAGDFVNDQNSENDLLIVGDIVTKKLEDYLKTDLKKPGAKFTVMSKVDCLYRLEVKDSFLMNILKNPKNMIVLNKMQEQVKF